MRRVRCGHGWKRRTKSGPASVLLSYCPTVLCAACCAQLVYARGNDIIHIEGDPCSPTRIEHDNRAASPVQPVKRLRYCWRDPPVAQLSGSARRTHAGLDVVTRPATAGVALSTCQGLEKSGHA